MTLTRSAGTASRTRVASELGVCARRSDERHGKRGGGVFHEDTLGAAKETTVKSVIRLGPAPSRSPRERCRIGTGIEPRDLVSSPGTRARLSADPLGELGNERRWAPATPRALARSLPA